MGHPTHTCNHSFRGATDSHQHIHWCSCLGDLNGPGNVTIRDEADTSSSLSYLANHVSMAGSVQDQDSDIAAGRNSAE